MEGPDHSGPFYFQRGLTIAGLAERVAHIEGAHRGKALMIAVLIPKRVAIIVVAP